MAWSTAYKAENLAAFSSASLSARAAPKAIANWAASPSTAFCSSFENGRLRRLYIASSPTAAGPTTRGTHRTDLRPTCLNQSLAKTLGTLHQSGTTIEDGK